MSDAEDEYDALPDIYSGIDFSTVPFLSGSPGCGSKSSLQNFNTGTGYRAWQGNIADTASNASDLSFDELDEATLSQLDAIEAAFVSTLPGKRT